MCGVHITNNRFGCGGSEVSNDGPRSSCGTIVANYTPPAAQQILIADNAWDNASTAVCSRKTSCNGGGCEQLLGRCDPSPATLSAEWVAAAEQLCAKRGFRPAELRLLGAGERVAALEAAGLAPLERVRVLSALEAG